MKSIIYNSVDSWALCTVGPFDTDELAQAYINEEDGCRPGTRIVSSYTPDPSKLESAKRALEPREFTFVHWLGNATITVLATDLHQARSMLEALAGLGSYWEPVR